MNSLQALRRPAHWAGNTISRCISASGRTEVKQSNCLAIESLEWRRYLSQILPFQVSSSYSIGAAPSDVVAADINGQMDAIAVETGDNTVSVSHGNGRGGFISTTTYSVGSAPVSLAVGNFGNGYLDIVTANSGDDTVSVLLGNSSGTFSTATNYAVGASPQFVLVGDFTGNGKLDIATANYAGAMSTAPVLSTLLGNGDGTFQTAWTSTVTSQYWGDGSSLAMGDFNGDGIPDLAISNPKSDQVQIVTGNGDGTFTYSTSISVPDPSENNSAAYFVASGDLNGDGKADLVVTSYAAPATPVQVYLGNGNDTFSSPTTYYAGSGPGTVAIADLNGDGKPDIVVTNADYSPLFGSDETGGVSALLNNGHGTFAPSTAYGTGAGPVAVAIGDFNGDGVPDLITADSAGNDLCLNLGIGNGTFSAARDYSVLSPTGTGSDTQQYPWNLSASGDFNNDGIDDVAVASFNSSGASTVDVLLGNSNGTFQSPIQNSVGSGVRSIAVAKFDGNFGVATANSGDGTISVLTGWTSTGFANTNTYTVGGTPNSIYTADLNGDGHPDLIVSFWDSSNVAVLLNNGDGTFGTPRVFTGVAGASSVVAGDLNGDGLPDIVQVGAFTSTFGALLNLGNSGGVWQGLGTVTSYDTGNGDPVTNAVIGDFNGDGKADVAFVAANDNTLEVLPGNGDGTLGSPVVIAHLAATPVALLAGDINGDGLPDLVTADGTANTTTILLNQGNSGGSWSGFATPQSIATGSDVSGVATGDFNNDGNPDLVTSDRAGENVTVLLQDQPPTNVTAGGPYQVLEGATTTLTASATSSNGGSLYYEWDFDYDGVNFNPTEVGSTVTLDTSAEAYSGLPTDTVAVEVTDLAGAAVISTAVVTFTPETPNVTSVVGGATVAGQAENTISWTDSTHIATEYLLQRYDMTEGTWETVNTVSGNATSAIDIPPDPTQTDQYQVIASDGVESAPSNTVTIPDDSGINTDDYNDNPVVLTSYTDIDAYDTIFVAWSDGGYIDLGGSSTGGFTVAYSTSITDSGSLINPSSIQYFPAVSSNGLYGMSVPGLVLGQSYYFQITDNQLSLSNQLTTASVPAMNSAPGNIGSVTVVPASSTQEYVTWSPQTTASVEGYYIAAKASGASSYTTVASVSAGATSVLVNSLQPSTSYTFEVFAFNPDGESSSATASSAVSTFAQPTLTYVGSYYAGDGATAYAFETPLISGLTENWEGSANGMPVGTTSHTSTNFSTFQIDQPTGTPFSITLNRTGVDNGEDSTSYYSYAPTIAITGTETNDSYNIGYNSSNKMYTISGGVGPVSWVLAPSGIDLQVYGHGGQDSLAIDNNAVVALMNNVGADGTDMAITVESNATLDIAAEEDDLSSVNGPGSVTYTPNPSIASLSASTGSTVSYTPTLPSLPSGDYWRVNWDDQSENDIYQGTTPSHSYAGTPDTYDVLVNAFTKNGTPVFEGPENIILTVRATGAASSLPAPYPDLAAYTFASGSISLPSGTDPFSPPTSPSNSTPTITTGEPQIDQITQTGEPGDVLALTCENLSSTTTFWAYGQTTNDDGVFAQAQVTAVSGQAASIVLPPSLPEWGVYLVWARNGTVYSPAVVVNQPQIWWADTNTAYPGGKVSLFGTNLAYNNGMVPYADQSWVYITGNGVSDWLPVSAVAPASSTTYTGGTLTLAGSGAVDVNPYKVDFTLPTGLTNGDTYQVYVYNGHGGDFGISAAYSLTVKPGLPYSAISYTAALYEYNAIEATSVAPFLDSPTDSEINPVGLQDALYLCGGDPDYNPNDQSYSLNYSLLELPAGTAIIPSTFTSLPYNTSYGGALILPDGVTLKGALNSDGSSATTIEAAPLAGLTSVIAVDGDMASPFNGGLSQLIIKANDGLVQSRNSGSQPQIGVVRGLNVLVGFTVNDVTIDGQNQVAMTSPDTINADPSNVAEDLSFYKGDNIIIENSTFTGKGVLFGSVSSDVIVDNCNFYSCGIALNGQIYGDFTNHISVTRCTDQGLFSNITNQGQGTDSDYNPDYDSASRLICLGASSGYLYAGDNQTYDMYPVNEIDSGMNGGEQILVESYGDGSISDAATASSLGILSFNSSTDSMLVSASSPFEGTSNLGYSIVVNSGPGAGEMLTPSSVQENIVGTTITYTIYFAQPMPVAPTTSSVLTYGNIAINVVAFQNTLRGDGLQCFQGQSAGINFTGANSIVDDNNISGVAFGIGMYHDTTGDVNSFNIYSNNSFSNVETGIDINANADPNSVANTPWFFANVFRGNLVSGIASGSNSVFGGGITFITNAKDSASVPLNTSQFLMNVLESNIITDTPKGFQFITTSTPDSGTTSAPGGVVDTVLWNDFASSDGSLGNALFTHIYYGEADSDSSPYILEPNDQWENFFN